MRQLLFVIVLSFGSGVLFAGAEEVSGDWECEAYVDRTYRYVMTLTEGAEGLEGLMNSEAGELELRSVSYEDTSLSFEILYPEGGLIDFTGSLGEEGLSGKLGNSMFQGSWNCKKQE